MSEQNAGKRYTRGVRASRVALSRALLESGLKTQVAIAQQIAETEGLESPPKDSVSRAFREKPVDPVTISRIARALKVEPHLLYLSAEQSAPAEPDEPTDLSSDTSDATPESDNASNLNESTESDRLPRAHQVFAVAIIVTIAAILFTVSRTNPTPLSAAVDLTRAPGGVLTVVLAPDSSGTTQGLLQLLSREVGDKVRISLPGPGVADTHGDAAALRETLRAHLLLTRTEERLGRYLAIGLHWSTKNAAGLLASEAGLSAERTSMAQRLSESAGQVLARVAERKAAPANSPQGMAAPPSIAALQHYIEGRAGLDEAGSDATFRQAEGSFRAAIEDAPEWAPAHAGLCEAKLFASWTDNEQSALEDARKHCFRAITLEPDNAYAQSAWSHYLRRTGQSNQVLGYLASPQHATTTQKQPVRNGRAVNPMAETDRIDTLGQLAEADFALYTESGERDFLHRATDRLKLLTALEPDYWRWHSLLATYYYYAQELELSVEAGKNALALAAKPLVHVNLGMAQFCLGDMDGMLQSFRSVTTLDPTGYFGYEYAGVAQFYLGNHAESTRLRRLALQQIGSNGEPEIHQMWGGLGDALRHAGKPNEALAAYQQAAEILERDFLAGTSAVTDEAHRSYYSAIVVHLRQNPIDVTVDDLQQLLTIELDQSARVRVAQLAKLQGSKSLAQQQALTATKQCAGLARHPDFVDLNLLTAKAHDGLSNF